MSSDSINLRKLSEDYTEKALRKEHLDKESFYNKLFNSKVRNERRALKKETKQKREMYMYNYIKKRYPKEDPSNPSKQAKKAASDSFNNKIEGIITLKNEEIKRKNNLRKKQLEKRKAEEKARQERTNNECTKIKTKEECVSPQNINNCYWNVTVKKNQHGDTLWDDTCQKITKRSIRIGKRTRRRRKPSRLGSISEEGDDDGEELSTNALTPQQQQRLTLQSIGQSLNVNNRGAGKRKRKTRKRKRRRTKKKRRRKKRKTKKRKKSRRRR